MVWLYEVADADDGEKLSILILLVFLRAARSPSDQLLAALLRQICDTPDVASLRERIAISPQAEIQLIESILIPLHPTQLDLTSFLKAVGVRC